MVQLHYQHPDTWFGDCMPFAKDGIFYLFHQRDTRQPGPFGEPFGWALATTTDFVTYTDHGEVLPRGGDDEQDQFIFAGSVFEAGGTFFAMYTGFNRDFPDQGKASQVLMLATSDDLITWTKTGQQVAPPQEGYDPDDWRDPFVLWSEERQEYVMILGARLPGPRALTGRTVYFTSPDLKAWEFRGDFWAPQIYSMHEMPDLFRIGDHWYLLTTEYSDKSKTVYRMSTSLEGPWSAPVDDAFDGRAYYAARSAESDGRRYLFGWVPTKEGDDDLANWQWGGTLVVHEVYQRPDFSLGVRPPAGIMDALPQTRDLLEQPMTLSAEQGLAELPLLTDAPTLFRLETTIRFGAATRSVSLRLGEETETGHGYEYLLRPGENRLQFDRRPNLPWHRYADKGLERPIELLPDHDYALTLIVDDDICTLYVDGVALNARMYAPGGSAVTVQVIEGSVEVLAATVRTA